MSLVIALRAADGIITAGDRRGTIGDPRGLTAISDVHKKIHRLSSHCGIGVVGTSELGASLIDRIESQIFDANLSQIDEVLHFLRNRIREQFNDWLNRIPIKERPQVVFLVCGYRFEGEAQPQPMIYMLQSSQDFAPLLMSQGMAMIGVPQYATYLAHRYYDPQMNKEQVSALVEFLIFETATQDPKVGGSINISVITADEGYREISERGIQQLRNANEQQSDQLRTWFFKGR